MLDTQRRGEGTAAFTSEITVELSRVLGAHSARARALGPAYEELWRLALECLGDGKLLRPRLLMGSFDALTADTSEATAHRAAALEVAAGVEILHFAFLLHDDLIDEDVLRRGKANLIGHIADGALVDFAATPTSEQRLHWARSNGLLAGDLMLTIAHQTFARVRLPECQRLQLLDVLDATVAETVAGEYYDVGLADRCLTSDTASVLDMTRMKTATYTFELPLRAAAIIAGADPRVEQQLRVIGRHLGVAFQLQDDLLSAFSKSDAHGKDQFSDFREGKETALIAFARSTAAWPALAQLLDADDFSHASGTQIQRLLTECGAQDFIESRVHKHLGTALDLLTAHSCAIPPALGGFLEDLIDTLEGRAV